ncbi:unnamed protein product [Ectocarpus sp. CCAP 1310/34]|nr:unnamed protein product [Ectocarpus sp. CCAP 1310/34]
MFRRTIFRKTGSVGEGASGQQIGM